MAMTQHTIRIQLSLLSFVAAIFVVGCAKEEKVKWSANDHFLADDAPRSADNFWKQQTANAARADGTLYAHHFTAGELNSLGKQKLTSMLYGPEAGKVDLYLDVPKDGDYAMRESTVTTFLTQKGLASTSYSINAGANPNAGTPAAQGIKSLVNQGGGGSAMPVAK